MRKSLRQKIRKQPNCANCDASCNDENRAFSEPLLDAFQSCSVEDDLRNYLKSSNLRQKNCRGGVAAKRLKKETIKPPELPETETEVNYDVSDWEKRRKSRKVTTVLDALLKVFGNEWKLEPDILKSTLRVKENLYLCTKCSKCLSQMHKYYSQFIQFTQESLRRSHLYPVVCHSKHEYAAPVSSKILTGKEQTDCSLQLQLKTRLVEEREKTRNTVRDQKRKAGSISPRVLEKEHSEVSLALEVESEEAQSELNGEELAPKNEAAPKLSRPSGQYRRQKAIRKRGPHRRVKCSDPECPEVFLYHWLMNHHVKMDHEKKTPSKCSICNFSSFDHDVMESHFCTDSNEEEHQDPATRDIPLPRCGFCNQPFTSKSSVIQHSRIHDRSLIKCTFMNCHRSFLRMSHLEKHERVVHGAEDFGAPDEIGEGHQCTECGKVFSSKATFKIHLEIHSSERKYLCINCGMSFKQRRSLTRHNLIHKDLTAIRLHECPLCHKSFKRKYNLTQHYQSKLHPQSVVEKLIKGEELVEDDFRKSMRRQTRIVRKRIEAPKVEVILFAPPSPSCQGKHESASQESVEAMMTEADEPYILEEAPPIYVASSAHDLFPSNYGTHPPPSFTLITAGIESLPSTPTGS